MLVRMTNLGGSLNARAMFGVACGALVLAACAGSPTTTVTVTETATAPAAQSEAAAPTEEAESVAPAPEPDVIVVADMVGQNYQDAQDVWRASGLVVIPAEDATGANRLPFIDSNWYVVAQSPKAGTEVPTGASITATVKKYTDD